MANTKLNITQRRYLLKCVIDNVLENKNKEIKRNNSPWNPPTISFSTGFSNKNKTEEGRFTVAIPRAFSGDVCDKKAHIIKETLDSTSLEESWYHDEYLAGNYTIKHEMGPCMHRPRVRLEFTNEQKALKKKKSKVKRTLNKEYDDFHVLIDQARADVMELNKWYKNEVVHKVMLSSDGEFLLAELLSSVPK